MASALADKRRTPGSEKADSTVPKDGPQSPPNPLMTPSINPLAQSTEARAIAWVAAFPFRERQALHSTTKAPGGASYDPRGTAWKLAAWEAAGRP